MHPWSGRKRYTSSSFPEGAFSYKFNPKKGAFSYKFNPKKGAFSYKFSPYFRLLNLPFFYAAGGGGEVHSDPVETAAV